MDGRDGQDVTPWQWTGGTDLAAQVDKVGAGSPGLSTASTQAADLFGPSPASALGQTREYSKFFSSITKRAEQDK